MRYVIEIHIYSMDIIIHSKMLRLMLKRCRKQNGCCESFGIRVTFIVHIDFKELKKMKILCRIDFKSIPRMNILYDTCIHKICRHWLAGWLADWLTGHSSAFLFSDSKSFGNRMKNPKLESKTMSDSRIIDGAKITEKY